MPPFDFGKAAVTPDSTGVMWGYGAVMPGFIRVLADSFQWFQHRYNMLRSLDNLLLFTLQGRRDRHPLKCFSDYPPAH